MEKAGALELFVIIAGTIALLLVYAAPGGYVPQQAEQQDPDVWGTPYYLRYNVPMTTDQKAILPRTNPLSFGLGVPAQSVAAGQLGGVF